jgi:hypothetical protein
MKIQIKLQHYTPSSPWSDGQYYWKVKQRIVAMYGVIGRYLEFYHSITPSINPYSLICTAGQELSVTITGENTHFGQGTNTLGDNTVGIQTELFYLC